MSDRRTALVLGATGGVGYETARALLARGWHVRALHRRPGETSISLPGVDWVAGDAMDAEAVLRAAAGADVILHGVNPPGYRHWRQIALPMLDNAIGAARAVGARLVFPGTVYNYGPDALPLVAEDTPQTPRTRKGAIRVEMEARLACASAADGLRVLILRGGDFFGPHTGNSWFSQAIVKPGQPLRKITYPGRPDAGHAWAYLPDFALTIARLLDRSHVLERFAAFHFGGHWFERGIELAEQIRLVAGRPDLPIRRFPWPALLALTPFVRLFREMAEMRYLWTMPLRLDNRKLVAFLGAEPHTPIGTALTRTLSALDCLDVADDAAKRMAAA